MTRPSDMSLAFYAVHNDSRMIYEIRPVGDFLLIRPAANGHEREIGRITMREFDREFNPFLAKFLIPNQLGEEDYMTLIED